MNEAGQNGQQQAKQADWEAIRMAYKQLYRNGLSFDDAKAQIAKGSETVTELALFNEFFARTTRGIIR